MTLPIVARCAKCGREFVTVGGDGIDHYPPQGWRPEGGWKSWLGERDPRYPPPECGGRIVPVNADAEAQNTREGG